MTRLDLRFILCGNKDIEKFLSVKSNFLNNQIAWESSIHHGPDLITRDESQMHFLGKLSTAHDGGCPQVETKGSSQFATITDRHVRRVIEQGNFEMLPLLSPPIIWNPN
jgi:hypothetical protein